ncbi:cutinase family protein [Antrihabitans cavernicola]|uniref:Cutinase family protein n=1 Tax=Antrihabitans cavernicola TaxID=2495913 RepID=A0A5A7S7B2_9NOCA|nr:cutinase family protein [Spelaeibacter cavernicola]KAA0018536.1 cutinase family protein [Spelaeibacter cavernicola]
MTLRDFFGRHRVASTVAAPAVLGVAAIVAASFALTSTPQKIDTQLTASVTECHDMVTISVAGRGDTPVAGTTKMLLGPNGEELPAALSGDHSSTWVDPVVNAPNGAVAPGSYAAVYIAYPANMDSYEDAVTTGVANSEQVMKEISKACPNTRFSIVGYSEGGDVARRVAMDVGNQAADSSGKYGIVDPSNVVGVVILADSGRTAGEGPFPGAKDPFGNPDGFNQQYQNGTTPAGGQGALPGESGGFGALNGKVASFCSDGDLTCSAPQNISLLQLAVNVGRQLNVDQLQREGLTPATGQDVAVVLANVAMKAFADIAADPNWMKSDETFLQVLLKVSDPAYKPGQDAPVTPVAANSVSSDQISPLAYLPQKVFKEIVGLIVTNQNTIPVVMNDPYGQTLAPGTGHHFDYWHDANPANGKPLTSAEYAAAWLTHLAQQAQAGVPVDKTAKPQAADFAAAVKLAADTKDATPTTSSTPTTTTDAAKSTTTSAPTTAATTTSETSSAAVTPEVATPPTSKVAATDPVTTTDPTTTDPATTDPTTTTEPTATTTESAPVTTTTPVPVG